MSKSSNTRNEMDKPMLSATQSKSKQKKGLSKKAKNRLYGAVAILIALSLISMIVVSVVKDSGVTMKNVDVITVGDQKIKGPELEFYYYAMVNSYRMQAQQIYSTYGIDLYGIDFSISLFKQVRDEATGQTWGEYIRDEAVDQLYELVLLEQAAKAENFTLTEDQLKEVDEQIAQMKEYASQNNMTYGALLRANFGKTIKPDTYRKYLEREVLVNAFAQHKAESFPIDQDALDERYTKDPSEFDAVSYYRFNVYVELPEDDDADSTEKTEEDKKKEAEALKEAVAKKREELENLFKNVKTKDEFLKLAKELTATTDSEGKPVEGKTEEDLIIKNAYSGAVPTSISEWMFDDDRRAGDIELVENDSYVSVYYFIDKNTGDYATRSVRHILLAYDEDDKDVTEDEVKAKLEEIYNTWKNGAKTEESFAELAEKHSEDTGSAANGGLYENVTLGQMIDEFEAWLFDDARKPGDTEIIKTDYGFHLMYYVGEGDTARNVKVESTLRSELYEEYFEGLTEAKPLVRHESGIARVK